MAYYVQWHMLEVWRPLLFCDEEQEAKMHRDPVAPAKRSASARRKAATKRLADGHSAVHSFRTLLASLSSIVRNRCQATGTDAPAFELVTTPEPEQRRALDLIETISV